MSEFDKIIQEILQETRNDEDIEVYGMMFQSNIRFQHLTQHNRTQWFSFLDSYSEDYGVEPRIQTFSDEQFNEFINKVKHILKNMDFIDEHLFVETIAHCQEIHDLQHRNATWIIKTEPNHGEYYIGCEVDTSKVSALYNALDDDIREF